MRRKTRWLALMAALALVLAACTTAADTTTTAAGCETTDSVTLQLQWVTQSQFAGYYVADQKGFYADECLDVTILEGGPDIVPQTVLATGGAEFAEAWVPKALVTRQQGEDIVNIAQVFERSGTRDVSFATANITSPADWEGKKVGAWGFGNEFEKTAAINQAGVTVDEIVVQNFDMLALLNGEIDTAMAMIYNEYAQVLEAENPETGELYQPSDFNVVDFNEVGTAMLQDAVWVRADWLAEAGNADIAERFLKASFRGWIHCLDEFQECVDIVLNTGSTLGSSHQAWQLNEILGLIFPATNGIGVMNQSLWDQTVSVATSQVLELEGAQISPDAFRTDLAKAAVDALRADGYDVDGDSYSHRTIELLAGGE